MSEHTKRCLERQLGGDGECECGVPGWRDGVRDSIRLVESRRQFLLSLGAAAPPAPGIISILDEIRMLLEAMMIRGSYSSVSILTEVKEPLKGLKTNG